ncbi:MBL fold metallo-hydrolase [Dyella tabacisoli]|uniref:MBL fold metallo-hydrolase n=2 Tax=Dyella tabacisoli TaxID=2282381 RepID=A0A369UNL8_9GAMM|nr:MBL fold metallo-hydrolase [Dyella tabacisoli]
MLTIRTANFVARTLSLALIAAWAGPALSEKGLVDNVNAEAAKGVILAHPLRANVAELEGSGGNITVLSGPDGKFMVDSGIALSKPAMQASLDKLGSAPVKYVVNTHWHWDHSDGDAWLHEAGATVIATPQTVDHLTKASRVSDWNFTFPPVSAEGVPSVRLTTDKTYTMNGESVVVHPLMPSHTDGDISVYFKKADVLATGDTFWNGIYPFIDDEHGGGINGTIAAVDSYLKFITDKTIIVPGHGAVADRKKLLEYRSMLVAIRDRVAVLKRQGKTLSEVVAAKPTAPFDAKWGNFIVTPELFTKLVYESV